MFNFHSHITYGTEPAGAAGLAAGLAAGWEARLCSPHGVPGVTWPCDAGGGFTAAQARATASKPGLSSPSFQFCVEVIIVMCCLCFRVSNSFKDFPPCRVANSRKLELGGSFGILGAAMEFASQRQFAESVEFGRNVLRVRVQGPRKGRGPSVRLPPSGPLPSEPGGRAARRRTEFSSGFRYGVSCSCPTHEHVDFCLLVTTATFTRTRAPPRSAGRFRRAWTPAFRTFTP